jgi:hypothetical protein
MLLRRFVADHDQSTAKAFVGAGLTHKPGRVR